MDWGQEVVGSNPAGPTPENTRSRATFPMYRRGMSPENSDCPPSREMFRAPALG